MVELLRVENLVKKYGEKTALKGISFSVEKGEIYGILGPNGAGKTTTLRIVATLLKPTSGRVLIDGVNAVENPLEARKMISYLPEEAGAYPYMTGREYLEFVAELYTQDESKAREMVELGCRISGLGSALNDKTKTYSKGMKRRLQLARALMVLPKLAILDEPTSGVDVIHSMYMRKSIKEIVEEHSVTVLLSSHNMLEVEYLCDRIALLHEGRILVEGTPEHIKTEYKTRNLEEAFAKVVGL